MSKAHPTNVYVSQIFGVYSPICPSVKLDSSNWYSLHNTFDMNKSTRLQTVTLAYVDARYVRLELPPIPRSKNR